MVLVSPAQASIGGIPAVLISAAIPLLGLSIFLYILFKRIRPLLEAAPDERFNRYTARFITVMKFAIFQYRQPRYMMAGVLHILLFAGFIVLSVRSFTLVMLGIFDGFTFPGLNGDLGNIYDGVKDGCETIVLIVCVIAMIRRGVFRPRRYEVPPEYGRGHGREAFLVLALIAGLMLCDMVFEGTIAFAHLQEGTESLPPSPGTGSWIAARAFETTQPSSLQTIHLSAFFLHHAIFFSFLCLLPLGKHFHVITSLPNVFFGKLDRGTVKPVRWGLEASEIDAMASVGVKAFEDFTWKHMMDFFSCADCGRCSDQCPASAVGRPLSPRFISIKCRDYAFSRYPIVGKPRAEGQPLVGHVLHEEEIWSCTTCGACEEECPLLIEYIDKIVDLRRGLVDDGMVPRSLRKPLQSLEKRGNPYGKLERRRGDWAKDLMEVGGIKILNGEERAKTLYFVDSITSYDDRIQEIGRATARVLKHAGVDFGLLGQAERDSGHEARRFGEEMLFLELREHNTRAIIDSGVEQIVTSDPHAFNALEHDYQGMPPVMHVSQVLVNEVSSGRIGLKAVKDSGAVYTYHDSCYLGRHNGIYDAPRELIDAIPGLKRVEMRRCRDRSFCCGGGGLAIFYEPSEERRMGRVRVEMAKEAGANVIVTACPFCLVHIEDGIRTSGLEREMQVLDLVELIDRHVNTE